MNVETIIVGPIEVNCYIVTCKQTNKAAIIDPGENADEILKVVAKVEAIIEKSTIKDYIDIYAAPDPPKQITNGS